MKRALAALRRSLFARLLLIFVGASFGVALVLTLSFELAEEEQPFQRLLHAHLARYVSYLVDDLGSPPQIERAQRLTREVPIEIRIDGPGMRWSSHPDFPPAQALEFDERGHALQWRGPNRHYVRAMRDGYRILIATPPFGYRAEHALAGTLGLAGSLAVLLLCYLAVRRLFAPIRWLRSAVQRLGQGDLDHRVPVTRRDELGELSEAVNAMAADVQGMLESKRQLLFAISHELRSPITRARLALELMPAGDRHGLDADLDAMERIVADLLEGERLGSRHAVLHREAIDLAALLNDLVSQDFAAAREHIELSLAAGLEPLYLDGARIRVLVRNLLDNALDYRGARPVELSLAAAPGQVTLCVRDHGEGMAPEHLARAAEPFYRADPSRRRRSGGTGLGLYLCQRIAEAHGGRLRIESRPGAGTLATVELPREPQPRSE